MTEYIIVGGGGFGLHTALNLRKHEPDAIITIFDKNIKLSSTMLSPNGIIYSNKNIEIDIFNLISFNLNSYNKKFYLHKINNIEWLIIYIINCLFIKKKQNFINNVVTKNNNKCNHKNISTDYNLSNYWDDLIKECKQKKINIIDKTEIINYNKNNNKIIISSNKNKYSCDKLILCTSSNLSLIHNKYYHKFIETFSGIGAFIKVKNIPSCFYYKNGFFISPYKQNLIRIGMHIEIGNNMGNYEITKDNIEYNKIVTYLNNNEEMKKLNLISIETIWRGTRAMSYDNLPFFTKIEKNIYWMSGGSFNGTFLSKYYGEWLSEYILDKPFTNIPNNFDPTLNRLKKIRLNFYLIFIMIFMIFIFYKLNKGF